jgi:hypothetical protein
LFGPNPFKVNLLRADAIMANHSPNYVSSFGFTRHDSVTTRAEEQPQFSSTRD